ncbi:MAG: 50S ribosomal protein L25 [Taibaiella sp.]|nr:50S ribosomal protein L25 [Taibaiella sp.]
MKTIKVQGELRSDLGKSATRRLRSEGRVPVVIYGGEEAVHLSVTPLSVRGLVYSPEFQIVEIDVNGKTYRCIMKDIQFDVVTDDLAHIDFLELVEGKKVIADLPLNFTGQPQGVKDGGRLVLKLKSVKVRTYPKYLREHLDVNIDDLQLNGNIRVQDIVAENMEVMNPPRIPIASVVMTRALKQAEAETEPAKK